MIVIHDSDSDEESVYSPKLDMLPGDDIPQIPRTLAVPNTQETSRNSEPLAASQVPKIQKPSRLLETLAAGRMAKPQDASQAPKIQNTSRVSKLKDAARAIENDSPEPLDLDEGPSDVDEMVSSIGEYDSSTLDSYLANTNLEHNPNHPELLATQKWGAIDPRISWPKRVSADEYAEKQAEIKARGTRKQNMSKLLTPQVRKERADKGWNVHQRQACPAEDDEKGQTRVKHLLELFGATGLDVKSFVPGSEHGKLVMTGMGQKGKKKTFPVTRAP